MNRCNIFGDCFTIVETATILKKYNFLPSVFVQLTRVAGVAHSRFLLGAARVLGQGLPIVMITKMKYSAEFAENLQK